MPLSTADITTAHKLADAPVVDLLSARLRAADYQQWRAQVQVTGGCTAPIHLTGSSTVFDRDGAVLVEHVGRVMAPCGNRRAAVCPACSDRYAADAYHLLRAGLAGDDQKGVPTTAVVHPRAFLTLTAPSFGPVHTRTLTRRGQVIPCRCGDRHHTADPRLGAAVDPDTYDYTGAVLWQAHAGQLWARFTIALRRALGIALGVPGWDFSDQWSPGARSSTSAPSPRLPPRSSRTAEASSPTPPSPATSPSTPPNPRAPLTAATAARDRTGPSATASTSPTSTSLRTTDA